MSIPHLRPVVPVRPAAPYVGGKRALASLLVRKIAAIPHATYAEPFVGMGGVFLRRTSAPTAEVINDASRDVATFFRVLQRHYDAFSNELRFTFTSRAEFERLMKVDPATLTDLERAIRFLYLLRTAFGGKVAGRNFGVSHGVGGRFDVTKLAEILAALNERLAGVVIENLDWAAFIARYDRPGTLFYLDPPYWGAEDYYGAALFPRADFERLAATLRTLRGRFLLSLNDVPQVRSLFAGFAIEPVRATYTISGAAQPAGELIIAAPAA
jgi:DNA adenine methylase